jgi:hypothetical protein
MAVAEKVLKTDTSIGHAFACFNKFARQIKPPALPHQRAFDNSLVNLTLFFRFDTKLVQQNAKALRINGAPLRQEIPAVQTPTSFCGPVFHCGIRGSRPPAVVADYLVA